MSSSIYIGNLVSSLKRNSNFKKLRIVSKKNPVLISTKKKKFSILVSEITDQQRREGRPDERSIQVSRTEIDSQKKNKKKGYQPVFLGYFQRKSGKIFQGYFPDKFETSNTKTRVSDFSKRNLEDDVINFGPSFFFGKRLRWRQPLFEAEDVSFYLENIDWLHKKNGLPEAKQIADLRTIFNASKIYVPISESDLDSSHEDNNKLSPYEKMLSDLFKNLSNKKSPSKLNKKDIKKRTKILTTSTKKRYKRDKNFAKKVMNAYENKCAICDIGLGITEASHIIPHNQDDSNDDVKNGIALCPNHHSLYDDIKLFFIGNNGQIKINQEVVMFLRELKIDKWVGRTLKELGKGYRIPKNKKNAPSEKYIEISKKYRLHPK